MTTRDTVVVEAVIGGVKFRRIERDCGGIIVIDGKRGYVWSSVDGHERAAKYGPGVYHCEDGVSSLVDGVDVAEYRKAMRLK